jgi:predicted Rossmann fold flavoprotein
MKQNKVAVIGAGAAGLMSAYQAAVHGAEVFLFERNDSVGKKILISGKGRCNLTNIKDISQFIQNIPGNGKFLYSALTAFTNNQLIDFFRMLGVETKIERGGRVFPLSDKSVDIVKALKSALFNAHVKINYKMRAKELLMGSSSVRGICFFNIDKPFYCDKVVIATGGVSYPSTGSTGDGYNLARQAGHTITDIRPSLVPLVVKEDWVKQLQGLTLKNVTVTSYVENKKIESQFGEMLFTHFGVSGPIILSLSRKIMEHLGEKVIISVNLKPALDRFQLDHRLLKDFKQYERRCFKNSLDDLLPKKLIPVFIDLCGVDPDKPVNQISKLERQNIIEKLIDLRLTITGCKEKQAIVTRGGLSVKEINPKTMESRLVNGLYFAGEVIDIDGLTGGYNLQAAFSTGYLAGLHSAVSKRREIP